MNALWIPINAVQLVLVAAWTVAWIVVAGLVGLVSGPRLPLRMARIPWAAGVLGILRARVRISFEEPLTPGARLFVANHQSPVDIPVLFRTLPPPLRFIAKAELFGIPFLGWYMRATGMIPVDRSQRGRAVKDLARVGDRLPEGTGLIAFPEGTRSRDGEIGPFRGGPFVVALERRLPIVPVAIAGARDVVHRAGFSGRPGTILVRVGRAIETDGLEVSDRRAVAAQAREALLRLQAELRGEREPEISFADTKPR